jgi:cation transport ATPase
MQKTILTFGLIAGTLVSLWIVIGMTFHDAIGWDNAEVLGYTAIVLSFLLIYFGVRSYRDNVAGGTLSFGRAFAVGALIALVASTMYVGTWQVMYYTTDANMYLEKYQVHVVEEARADGESQAAIDKRVADMQKFAEMYKNPAINVAVTFLEPLPIGLIIALISAGILRRKRNELAEQPA